MQPDRLRISDVEAAASLPDSELALGLEPIVEILPARPVSFTPAEVSSVRDLSPYGRATPAEVRSTDRPPTPYLVVAHFELEVIACFGGMSAAFSAIVGRTSQ
jgi:hypothetical protein